MTTATIVGYGTVGKATAAALSSCGVQIADIFDPPCDRPWPALESREPGDWWFVCVPTPSNGHGAVDLRHIHDAMEHARGDSFVDGLDCGPVVVIRSTVPPGVTEQLQRQHRHDSGSFLPVLHWPEFLTERTAMHDALHPARNVIGFTDHSAVQAAELLKLIPEAPYQVLTRARNAEMVKLASNAFYATKVSFFNQLYELCEEHNVEYESVRAAFEHDPFCAAEHLDVHHGGYRGYGGKCLPKDVRGLLGLAREGDGKAMSVLRAAMLYNDELRAKRR